MVLLDPTGEEIADNDDRTSGDVNSRIASVPLRRAGTYTIVAGSYDNASSGRFTLSLRK